LLQQGLLARLPRPLSGPAGVDLAVCEGRSERTPWAGSRARPRA